MVVIVIRPLAKTAVTVPLVQGNGSAVVLAHVQGCQSRQSAGGHSASAWEAARQRIERLREERLLQQALIDTFDL